MNVKDRKKSGAMLEKWTPFFIIVCTFTGAVLSSFLVYYFQGEFPYEVFTGGFIAAIILTVIQVVKQRRKKNNLPEADERVIHNVFRFFFICVTHCPSYYIYSCGSSHPFRQ